MKKTVSSTASEINFRDVDGLLGQLFGKCQYMGRCTGHFAVSPCIKMKVALRVVVQRAA